MRALLVVLLVGVVATGCSLDELLAPTLTPEECPAALLSGRLAPDPDGGAHVISPDIGAKPVRWPEGYVAVEDPVLRLVDPDGNLVASEGDTIYVGGGFTAGDELFIACGYVSRDPP